MENSDSPATQPIEKLETQIDGFDHIASGGLPKGRTTLFTGTSGSAKTVFATQFLVEGIQKFGQSGVFVTFEESVPALRRNAAGLGWNIPAWEAAGKWAFVDAAPKAFEDVEIVGSFNLDGLLIRIKEAVRRTQATRLCMDSIGSLFQQFTDSSIIRRELFNIANAVNELGVTTILTAERTEEYGPIGRYGVEEFVADNVVILRNVLEEEKRRRTVEILKFRGTTHLKGEFPFTILPNRGIVVIPLSALELKQKSTTERVTSGIPELDEMCGGGFFRDSIILLSGATGTGKTLTATQFLAAGAGKGEKCLFLAFEESREQLFRNAHGWGMDFENLERQGFLKVICLYPEVQGLEDHLIAIKRVLEDFRPQRLAVDSLSALERVAPLKSFREFVIGLTSFIKQQQIAGLLTATTPSLMGGVSVTETHISTITDSIILLRYVEIYGEMRRGITVLKMRGSAHDKNIREFSITARGMQIGKPFRGVSGILAGSPRQADASEMDHLGELLAKIP
jgi:circadian clock protein KaiC